MSESPDLENIDEEEVVLEDEINPPLPKKFRGGRYSKDESAVWNHFDRREDISKSFCKHCDFKSDDRRPGNLLKHLKRKHASAAADVEKITALKRPSSALSNSSAGSSSLDNLKQSKLSFSSITTKEPTFYDKNSKPHIELMRSLSILFASQSLPHLLVECEEFIDFVKLLNPKFKLPNRRSLSSNILKLSNSLKQGILEDLNDVKKLCVVLDIWTKKGLSESYLGVLIKYFHPQKQKIRMVLIALKKIEGSHTAEKIFENLKIVLDEWNIEEDRISFYITDSGSNIVKALKECIVEFAPILQQDDEEKDVEMTDFGPDLNLDEEEADDDDDEAIFYAQMNTEASNDLDEFDHLEEDQSNTFGYAKRLPCIAHQLTCVVRKCIDKSASLQPIIRSACRLVKAINQSMQKKEELLKLNNGKGLMSPSQTRWIYTYYVLQRLIESKSAVEQVIVKFNMNNVAINPLRWNQIEELSLILEPFASAVNELEGDAYSSINKVYPTLVDLSEQMQEKVSIRGVFGKTASVLKKELQERFGYILDSKAENYQPVYLVATFLDPEFIIGLTPEQREICMKFIMNSITQDSPNGNRHENLQVLDQPSGEASVRSKYGHFFKKVQSAPASLQQSRLDKIKLIQTKLDAYVQESLASGGASSLLEEYSPMRFWLSKWEMFGEISSFALNLLVVPASSAGIERVFSQAGIVQGNLRHRLSANSTERELMIKVNKDLLDVCLE